MLISGPRDAEQPFISGSREAIVLIDPHKVTNGPRDVAVLTSRRL